MTDPRTLANALLEDLEDGNLPGSPIRYQGEEIWLHTTGQVEGWLRTHLEKAGLIEAVEDNWTAPAASSPGQVDPEPPAPIRIDSLFGQIAQCDVSVSHPAWDDGEPVQLMELHLTTDGIARVVYRAAYGLDDVTAFVAAGTLVTPVGGA